MPIRSQPAQPGAATSSRHALCCARTAATRRSSPSTTGASSNVQNGAIGTRKRGPQANPAHHIHHMLYMVSSTTTHGCDQNAFESVPAHERHERGGAGQEERREPEDAAIGTQHQPVQALEDRRREPFAFAEVIAGVEWVAESSIVVPKQQSARPTTQEPETRLQTVTAPCAGSCADQRLRTFASLCIHAVVSAPKPGPRKCNPMA